MMAELVALQFSK